MRGSRQVPRSVDRMTDTKTLRLYEQVRSTAIDFGSYTPRIHRTAQFGENSTTTLKQRITDLELANKTLEERLKLVLAANAQLKEELANMKDYNSQLLNSQLSNGDSHYLVQELLITDVNHRLTDAKQEVSRFREEVVMHKTRAGAYIEDKRKLEGIVKRYRRMMAQTITTTRKSAHSSLDTSIELPQLRTPVRRGKEYSLKSHIKALLTYTQGLVGETNLRKALNSASAACKAVLNCQECSIFVYCKKLQKEYTGLFGYHEQPARILIGSTWVLMNVEAAGNVRDPLFSKLEDIGRGVIGDTYMIFPVTIKKQVLLVIQCEGIQNTPIENIAEVQLKLVIAGLQSMLTYYTCFKQAEALQTCIHKTSIALNAVANSRYHFTLSNAVHSKFPALLGFEGAAVLYVDEVAKEFFANIGASNDEERYARNVIRYPNTLGLASSVLASKGSRVFDDLKRHTLYSPEVDNLAGIREIHSGIMVCIPGTEGIVGILVLTNKLNPPISPEETLFIESIAKALGSFISGINHTVEAMELTIRMKEIINKLLDSAKNCTLPPNSQRVDDLVQILTATLDRWRQHVDNAAEEIL